MKTEGDGSSPTTAQNRANLLARQDGNIRALLERRYGFLMHYLKPGDRVLEVGSGTGASSMYLPGIDLLQSDVECNDWLNLVCSAEQIPADDATFDAVVAVLMLHHTTHPARVLREFRRVLKPGGHALIIEASNSVLLRALLSVTKHEYIDPNVDPFGEASCQRSEANWDGNNAIGDLLFRDTARYARAFPDFPMIHQRYTECLLFMNSGGVNNHTPYIPLPGFLLSSVALCDRVLCGALPHVFSLSQEVVLRKEPAA